MVLPRFISPRHQANASHRGREPSGHSQRSLQPEGAGLRDPEPRGTQSKAPAPGPQVQLLPPEPLLGTARWAESNPGTSSHQQRRWWRQQSTGVLFWCCFAVSPCHIISIRGHLTPLPQRICLHLRPAVQVLSQVLLKRSSRYWGLGLGA